MGASNISDRPKKAFLFYSSWTTANGGSVKIGGIQTYLLDLSEVVRSLGYQVSIVQHGNRNFTEIADENRVLGYRVGGSAADYRRLFRQVRPQINPEQDLVIWGTSNAVRPHNPSVRTIAINHGIGFDLLPRSLPTIVGRSGHLQATYKFAQRLRARRLFNSSEHLVCVDYNTLNWLRTMYPADRLTRVRVIPNFVRLPDTEPDPSERFTRILFARRFSHERGVMLMVQVADSILRAHPDASLTFAGEGPLEPTIRRLAAQWRGRVQVDRFSVGHGVDYHQQFDIAVIPSLGSEGTSLSALEAMAAGSVVVCTNVGGLTNLVMDGFNGRLVDANSEEIAKAIGMIITNPSEGNRYRANGYAVAQQSFSLSRWSNQWKSQIELAMLDRR